MLKCKIALVLASMALGLFACVEKRKEFRQGIVIAESKSYEASIFRQNCAICHGREAFGKEVDGRWVPSLRFGDAAKRSEEEIFRQIAYGKLPMPAFRKQLTESEIRRMTRFVMRDLQGREGVKGQRSIVKSE